MKAIIYRGILLVALCPSAIVLSCSQPESSPKLPAEMTVEEAKQALFDQSKRVKILANVGMVAKGLSAQSSIGTEDEAFRGASRELEDELQLQENEKIRSCIDQYFPQVMEHILGMVPNPLEYRFDYTTLEPDNPPSGQMPERRSAGPAPAPATCRRAFSECFRW